MLPTPDTAFMTSNVWEAAGVPGSCLAPARLETVPMNSKLPPTMEPLWNCTLIFEAVMPL